MRALDLEQEGRTQREIAVVLERHRRAPSAMVGRRRAAADREALRSHPAPGPAPKLTAEQLAASPTSSAWRRGLRLPRRGLDL